MRRIALFAAVLLLGGLVSSALAAQVEVQVVQDQVPVVGADIAVMSSTTTEIGVTDDLGMYTTEIDGRYFRVRVSVDQLGIFTTDLFSTTDSPVVIELTEFIASRGGDSK